MIFNNYISFHNNLKNYFNESNTIIVDKENFDDNARKFDNLDFEFLNNFNINICKFCIMKYLNQKNGLEYILNQLKEKNFNLIKFFIPKNNIIIHNNNYDNIFNNYNTYSNTFTNTNNFYNTFNNFHPIHQMSNCMNNFNNLNNNFIGFNYNNNSNLNNWTNCINPNNFNNLYYYLFYLDLKNSSNRINNYDNFYNPFMKH